MRSYRRTPLWLVWHAKLHCDTRNTDGRIGTYKAEAFNQNSQSYITTNDLAVQITVDETFDNDHRVVSQTSTSSDVPSKFTFSAADSGLHRLCFTPSGPAAVSLQGWFSGHDAAKGGVKIWLDMAIGESSKIESDDKHKIDSIVGKVRELNSRLADIRREQVFQRVSGCTLNVIFRKHRMQQGYRGMLTVLCFRSERQSFVISLNPSIRES